jgi:hypothetical protein
LIGIYPRAVVIAIKSLERRARDGAAALLGIMPFAALIGLAALWVLWSPSDIFADHPRLIMWTVGFFFAKVSSILSPTLKLCEQKGLTVLTFSLDGHAHDARAHV